jgi:hypothetical protein
MIFTIKTRNRLFRVFAILSCLTVAYHLAGVFDNIDDVPSWRHIIFTIINLLCVYGFLKRPKYFVYFLGILLIQQYYSHGSHFLREWNEKKQVDWISVFILILLPVALICVIEETQAKREA